MSEAFIGEVRMVGYNFAPVNWMLCNGAILPIAQNTALFSILGTTYGGDGKSTFALPNLTGQMPMHTGQGPGLSPRSLGEASGETSHALALTEMPSHTHALQGSSALPAFNAANGHVMAKVSSATPPYHDPANLAPAAPGMLQPAGTGQAHNNRQPYLALQFVICVQGIFPPRS
jgi:microcystin-dependent protein